MNIALKNITALLKSENGYKAEKTDIYIEGDTIKAVGKTPENFKIDKTIDGNDKFAVPGFINCHTHTYMSLFRNLADDLFFDDWLFKNIMPMEDKLSNEDAYWGALLSCIEMIKTGTTCFLDMHMFKNQTAKAAVDTGIRAVISRGLTGRDRNDKDGVKRVNEALEEAEDMKGSKRLSFMLAPHAIYTCDTGYIEFVLETAKKKNFPLHIHLSETRKEVKDSLEKYGMSPVEYLDKLGFFDVKTVAAHCVHLSDEDIEIMAKKNVNAALNPISNLKLGNGFAPVLKMFKSGVNLCIGTDSQASNNNLNLFSDMNYTAMIHKGTNEDALAISAFDALKFATENGANALGINAGSIEEGKKADISILNLNCPSFCPKNNLVSALVYSANGSEVDTVIIDGNIVMENKKMTMIDENEVYKKVNEILIKLKGGK